MPVVSGRFSLKGQREGGDLLPGPGVVEAGFGFVVGAGEEAPTIARGGDADDTRGAGLDHPEQGFGDDIHDADAVVSAGDGELARLMREGDNVLNVLGETRNEQRTEGGIPPGVKIVPIVISVALGNRFQGFNHRASESITKLLFGDRVLRHRQGTPHGILAFHQPPHETDAAEQKHAEQGGGDGVPGHEEPDLFPRSGLLRAGGEPALIGFDLRAEIRDGGVSLCLVEVQRFHDDGGK